MDNFLEQIEVGTRIWVGTYKKSQQRILTVTKLTPKQIVVGPDDRYKRENGARIGWSSDGHRITGIATPEDVAQAEAEQRERQEQRNAAEHEHARQEAERQRLTTLLPAGAWLSKDQHTGWTVNIPAATSADVERIAVAIKEHARPS